MSRWTHAICPACWDAVYPGSLATALVGDATTTCCWCGARTTAGIYVREDPQGLRCGGVHQEDLP